MLVQIAKYYFIILKIISCRIRMGNIYSRRRVPLPKANDNGWHEEYWCQYSQRKNEYDKERSLRKYSPIND